MCKLAPVYSRELHAAGAGTRVEWNQHLGNGSVVGLRIILDGDLCSHTAHGMDATLVTGADDQQTV